MVNAVKSDRNRNLFIKKGCINGREVRILLNTGARTNMITPGLASNVLLASSALRWNIDTGNGCQTREYKQVFRVKASLVPDVDGIPEPIFKVFGEEFKDVFLEQFPDGLLPMKGVNFELTLKKGAKSSSRAPFRLRKWNKTDLRNLSRTS
ncbi:unnamed protein product [Phytophthora fragariaefolia]|uniref:Unnamed protein product n=1 Tax=Phytophthora fragariaefolia TaxID=1490495 RepID=A0A9W6XYH6_9STRA|nr:unnamed protein product [Phytophthora fragariaefolia]